MNNTDKLLRAFIEASGYEIEGSIDISYGQVIKAGLWGVSATANTEFKFFPATDEIPESEYREVIRNVDYKVTKKDAIRFNLTYLVPEDIKIILEALELGHLSIHYHNVHDKGQMIDKAMKILKDKL